VYNALDLACLSSTCGEGFPNVLGEAMACGVPCAATDVGDAALVLGAAGELARPGDAAALAEALARLLERLEREGAGLAAACRERVVREFSLPRMVEATEALLRAV
jgi:glycosyltransferase involved in cell wall biosynthesis